jgi:hypothetical protein
MFTICLDCKVNAVIRPTCTQCRECWDQEARWIDQIVKELDKKKPAVNDHVCPCCGNDKVSKTEKSCWKCGGTL